jgi:DNA-binding IclR family transcriptional regulator
MKEDERSHVIAALASRSPDTWAQTSARLDKAFEDYARHGFCLSLGDWDRNVNAAGVPLHLQDGTIMALTCGAPSYLVSEEKVKNQLAHQLAMLARDIERLGV